MNEKRQAFLTAQKRVEEETHTAHLRRLQPTLAQGPQLPIEVFDHIFSLLPVEFILNSCCVCKYWDSQLSEQFWEALCHKRNFVLPATPLVLSWKQLASFRAHALETPLWVVKQFPNGCGTCVDHPGTIEVIYDGIVSDPDLEPCPHAVLFGLLGGACTIAAHDWRDYGYYKRASKNIVVYWRFGLFSIRRASFVSEDQAREHTDLAEAQDFLNKKKIPDLSLVAVADGRASYLNAPRDHVEELLLLRRGLLCKDEGDRRLGQIPLIQNPYEKNIWPVGTPKRRFQYWTEKFILDEKRSDSESDDNS